jgi:hypothetical protein
MVLKPNNKQVHNVFPKQPTLEQQIPLYKTCRALKQQYHSPIVRKAHHESFTLLGRFGLLDLRPHPTTSQPLCVRFGRQFLKLPTAAGKSGRPLQILASSKPRKTETSEQPTSGRHLPKSKLWVSSPFKYHWQVASKSQLLL